MEEDKIDKETVGMIAQELDGGSYFGILKNQRGWYFPKVRIRRSESHKEALDWIHDKFPGGMVVSRTKDGRPVYYLNYDGSKAYKLVEMVIDFLVEKQAHAQVILEFRESIEEFRSKHGLYAKLTPEEKNKRELFVREINILNERVPKVDIEDEGSNFYVTDEDLEAEEDLLAASPPVEDQRKADAGSSDEVMNLFDI